MPMFVLAGPITFMLIKAGVDVLSESPRPLAAGKGNSRDALWGLVACMAAGQVMLALLAITSYHVQIITRLSSAYPVWYWWLARSLIANPKSRQGSAILVFMVMYASIQGALFSSFLPPA